MGAAAANTAAVNTTTTNAAVTSTAAKNAANNHPASVRIAVVQTNFLLGDIKANAQKIKVAAQDASAKGADIIIFPELALMGSPAEDLLHQPTLPERIKQALPTLGEGLGDGIIVVGYPHVDHYGIFNSVAIMQGKSQKGFYHKRQLPNASTVDEKRYFNTGNNQVLFDYKGLTLGLLISSDIDNDSLIKQLKQAGADVLIVSSATVFAVDNHTQLKNTLCNKAKQHQLAIIYANSVGGQDDLVFDGGSMVINPNGTIAHEAHRFRSETLLVNFDLANKLFDSQESATKTPSTEGEIYQALMVGLRDYVKRAGFGGVIVGLSGGIDSALTLCIAVDALGADKVYAVMLPYEYTSAMSLEDAEAQAKRLNVSYTVCPIHDAVAGLRSSLAPLFDNDNSDATEENIQARARATLLMALSNRFGHMILNTSNKSESAVGFGTLYGDMIGGFGPLKDVYKTQVYRLANYRNSMEENPVIPERVILRDPSAELRPNQKDSDTLPDYAALDGILQLSIEQGKSFDEIVKAGFDPDTVLKVLRMLSQSEYKRRQSPFGTKINHRAFGRDYRYPVLNGWQAQF